MGKGDGGMGIKIKYTIGKVETKSVSYLNCNIIRQPSDSRLSVNQNDSRQDRKNTEGTDRRTESYE